MFRFRSSGRDLYLGQALLSPCRSVARVTALTTLAFNKPSFNVAVEIIV